MTSIHPLTGDPRDAARLRELAAELTAASYIGLDTEFLRERTYRPQLCLLQVATPARCECVDPLGDIDLSLFRRPLAAGGPTKIMHAARQDLEVLWPLFGPLAPLFDTQVAAGLTGLPAQVGYGELVRRLLGIELDKSHTRTDWSRRPLSDAQLVYAIEDVRHLGPLRDALTEQLDKLGRLAWLEEDMAPLHAGTGLFVDPDRAHERLKGLQDLDADRQRLGQLLAAWRERRAADRNRPRSWILEDAGLRALIAVAPRDEAGLRSLPELTPGFIDHSGAEILQVIESAGLPAQLPPLPGRTRPDPAFNDGVKKLGGVLRDVSQALGLAPELLATRRDLEVIARGVEDALPLKGWRRSVVGEALLAAR
jgi:ribonuclease D